jgi:hypothetical protein
MLRMLFGDLKQRFCPLQPVHNGKEMEPDFQSNVGEYNQSQSAPRITSILPIPAIRNVVGVT